MAILREQEEKRLPYRRGRHRAQGTGHRAPLPGGSAWPFCVSKKRKGYPIEEGATGHRAQGRGQRAQGRGHRAQDTGHRAQGTARDEEHRAQGTGHRAQATGHSTRHSKRRRTPSSPAGRLRVAILREQKEKRLPYRRGRHRAQGTGHRAEGRGHRAQGTGHRAQDM